MNITHSISVTPPRSTVIADRWMDDPHHLLILILHLHPSIILRPNGQYTSTSPDSVRMAENDHPLSTWMGVVSGIDLSTSDELRRNGRPQDVKVHMSEAASIAVVCKRPQLKRYIG